VPCQPGTGQSLAEAFLEEAVRAANEDIWGTLSCSLIVHPETEKQHGAAVQAALDALRYGSVVVNAWSLVGYLVMPGHWGAFQGDQTLQVGADDTVGPLLRPATGQVQHARVQVRNPSP